MNGELVRLFFFDGFFVSFIVLYVDVGLHLGIDYTKIIRIIRYLIKNNKLVVTKLISNLIKSFDALLNRIFMELSLAHIFVGECTK